MKLSISEIMARVNAVEDEGERAKFALANFKPAILAYIKAAYDPAIKWQLPEGTPPYKESPFDAQEGQMFNAVRRMHYFIEGKNNLTKVKRENLFVQTLEQLTPGDAKLLCAIKDKKLPYPRLDRKFIKKVFPDLIP